MQRCKLLAQVFSNALLRKLADKRIGDTLAKIRELSARIEKENIYLRQEIDLQHRHEEIIGNSETLRNMLSSIEQVAHTESTVLILGESGLSWAARQPWIRSALAVWYDGNVFATPGVELAA